MTPVPTGPGFDFNEFLRRLADHGVVAETPPPFVDSDGDRLFVVFCRRQARESILTFDDPEDGVTFAVVRSVCVELDLDPRDFGSDLDWLEPPDEEGPDLGTDFDP